MLMYFKFDKTFIDLIPAMLKPISTGRIFSMTKMAKGCHSLLKKKNWINYLMPIHHLILFNYL